MWSMDFLIYIYIESYNQSCVSVIKGRWCLHPAIYEVQDEDTMS